MDQTCGILFEQADAAPTPLTRLAAERRQHGTLCASRVCTMVMPALRQAASSVRAPGTHACSGSRDDSHFSWGDLVERQPGAWVRLEADKACAEVSSRTCSAA